MTAGSQAAEHSFAAMGTTFWLRVEGLGLQACFDSERLVREAEARLSRFLPGSALSRLNTERRATDSMLAAVAREALRAFAWTRGAFDPMVGAALISAGYDRSFERLAGRPVDCDRAVEPDQERSCRWPDGASDRRRVTIEGDTVFLTGPGLIDLGGMAKGWTVDRVVEQLARAGATGWVVDGGGDIRVGGQAPAGEWFIGIGGLLPGGDGSDYAIGMTDAAVATSSTRERRWRTAEPGAKGEAHHIIDPRTRQPAAGGIDTAVVVARDAVTADVLATALIADFDAVWPALAEHSAAALVHSSAHEWRMTPNMQELLR